MRMEKRYNYKWYEIINRHLIYLFTHYYVTLKHWLRQNPAMESQESKSKLAKFWLKGKNVLLESGLEAYSILEGEN